jgi:hypothetical protein
MRAEHVKAWLGDIKCEEKAARENPGKTANMGETGKKCRIFVQMIQTMGRNPNIDELDGPLTATKGWRQLPGDRPAGPLLESSEDHGALHGCY